MKMGNKELKLFILFLFVFFLFYFVPLHHVRWQYAILEGLFLVQEYAREHILFCLVPAPLLLELFPVLSLKLQY